MAAPTPAETSRLPFPQNRLAQNRAIFREVNERLRTLSIERDLVPWVERTEYFCECGAADCLAMVELTLAEYEAVRGDESTRVVSRRHASEAFVVVEETDRYLIVERAEPRA